MSLLFFYLILSIIIICSISLFASTHTKPRNLILIWNNASYALLLWGLGCLGFLKASSSLSAFWFSRLAGLGIILGPLFYYDFICQLLGLRKKYAGKLLRYIWSAAIIFILADLGFFELFKGGWLDDFSQLAQVHWWKYRSTTFFLSYLIFFWFLLGHAFVFLLKSFESSKGPQKEKLKYFLVCTAIALVLPTLTWFLSFKTYAYSYASFLAGFYPFIFAYALVTLRLMNYRLILEHTIAFSIVYGFVFTVSFVVGNHLIGFKEAFWVMCFLIIPSPFIYNQLAYFLEKRRFKLKNRWIDFDNFLKTLNQLQDPEIISAELTEKLNQTLFPEYSALYLLDSNGQNYSLRCAYFTKEKFLPRKISFLSALAKNLTAKRKLLKTNIEAKDPSLFEDGLIIPYFNRKVLYGFNVLGLKLGGKPYDYKEVDIFEALSDRLSLALENYFLSEEKKVLANQEQVRRQTAMDRFSASLAHEIDNPIYAIMGLAEMVKIKVSVDLKEKLSQDDSAYLVDRLNRLINDISRISAMIKAIREFSSRTDGQMSKINIDKTVNDFFDILGPQIHNEGINFEYNVERGIEFNANKIYLEEALMNLMLNAIHAVKHNRKKEKSIGLSIYTKDAKVVIIEVIDNGYGIKKEMLEDIFLDFVTTKASTEGTGMGLARVRKIAQLHQGRVWAESRGSGQGAVFFIEIPLRI